MSSQFSSELSAFHGFIGEQLEESNASLIPEECLAMWRAEHPSAADLAESITAVGRAVQQLERGEGKGLAQFEADFRHKHPHAASQ